MKIEISVATSELIDTLGIAWLKEIRENQVVNIEMAIMEEDVADSQKLISAINVVLRHLEGVSDDGQV